MAIARRRYAVLYFHRGPRPTSDQVDEAQLFGPGCMFRNATAHTVGEGMEPCDAVAGDVPRDYARKYPDAIPYADWLQQAKAAAAVPEPEEGQRRPNRVLGAAGGPPTANRRPAVDLPPAPTGDTPIPGLVGGHAAIELPPPPDGATEGPATSGLQPTGRGSKRQRAEAATDPRWTGQEAPPPPPPPV